MCKAYVLPLLAARFYKSYIRETAYIDEASGKIDPRGNTRALGVVGRALLSPVVYLRHCLLCVCLAVEIVFEWEMTVDAGCTGKIYSMSDDFTFAVKFTKEERQQTYHQCKFES